MMTRLARVAAIVLACMIAATPAFARHHHQKHYYESESSQIVSHPHGCPARLFCACGVSMKLWGYAKHMAAAAFFKYPRANPAPGMVAVRRDGHHVMYIERVDGNGNAVVYDPNSGGHQTRIHTRSLAGYRVVNPHG